MAYRRFRHIGVDKVKMDFAFFAIAFNIKKMVAKMTKGGIFSYLRAYLTHITPYKLFIRLFFVEKQKLVVHPHKNVQRVFLFILGVLTRPHNSFNIIYCKEVSSGLQCNNSCGTIEYRGEIYYKKSAYYVKKKLQNVDVYRSDGIISYTKSEVESDKNSRKLFRDSFG